MMRDVPTSWLTLIALAWLRSVSALTSNDTRWGQDTVREAGRCSLSSETCGSKGGAFGTPLPCVRNELAVAASERGATFTATLEAVCGPEVAASWTSTCCNEASLQTLSQSLQQAQAFIAMCPACSTSFRNFYCAFTCSPDQSTFVTVSQVQDLGDSRGPAVKSLELHVDEVFGKAFFDACKDVKFAATNGFAMEFIGGGAKDWLSFLRYMGKERPGLGSPFQINFPQPANEVNGTVDPKLSPINLEPLSCASSDPNIACACTDCPARCLSLPALPDTESHCHIGVLTCGSFFLILAYAIVLVSFVAGIGIRDLWLRRHSFFPNKSAGTGRIHLPPDSPTSNDGMGLQDPLAPENDGQVRLDRPRWTTKLRSLVGAGSTQQSYDGDSVRTRSSSSRRLQSGSSSANMPDSDSQQNSLSRQRLGQGASLLSGDLAGSYAQPRTYRLNTVLSNAFYRLGLGCATWPVTTILTGLVICGALNGGWARFAIEKDPVRLWVSQDSELAQQKTFFEEHFGPFYRTEQIFLSRREHSSDPRPLLDWPTLQWWADVESQIRSLRSPAGTTLADVCFAPTAESDEMKAVADCTVQSFMGYFRDSLGSVTEETWASRLDNCATNPTACLSSAGQPLNPRLLFGGIPGYSGDRDPRHDDAIPASQAQAIVITYVVDNSLDPQKVRRAEEWESALKRYLAGRAIDARVNHAIDLSYSTGVSLEEELNNSTNTDIPIVVLSYLVMFLYVSVSLGGTGAGLFRLAWAIILKIQHTLLSRKSKTGPIALDQSQDLPQSSSASVRSSRHAVTSALQSLLIDSKFLLGLFGIAIVLISVSTSVAIFSILGVKVTLIIAEVIPFLVLAIGVDNVFILGHELDRQNARAQAALPRNGTTGAEFFDPPETPSAEERIARALARMGPSILLSASCQTVAFALGAIVGMPAVRNFAIYAAGAVAINAMLQITIFVAAMALDTKRIESNRVDCFPVLRLANTNAPQIRVTESIVVRFIRSVYAPILLKRRVKLAVLGIFSGLFVASWICTDYIQLGLDQRLALPRDSYLVDYFNALDTWLDVGPPVYFVSDGIDVEHRAGQQSLCSRFSTCNELSIPSVLEAERKRPSTSYIAETPAVWLDDYFQWLNPVLETCCSVKRRDASQFCGANDNEFQCRPCYEDAEPGWNISMEGLPEGNEFMRYLRQWLISPANEDCALGGRAAYSTAVSLHNDDFNQASVAASHMRTYHTPLKSQSDFINALASARRISADLASSSNGRVFAYSLFYVFFEQYATIVAVTRGVLFLALTAVFVVTSAVLGSLRTGAVVVVTVLMIVTNVMGVMGLWHISLNAISLVNLVISIGIGVEFCSHIARAFMGAGSGMDISSGSNIPHSHPAGQRERDERSYAALVDVGSSVFSGITVTKLIGISVLALTRSKLLEIYYFRTWLTLIISGALHGLVFLPVALSFQGGRGYSLDDGEDEEYIESVARYRGRAFLAADNESSASSEDQY